MDIVKRLREKAGKYDECDWHSAIELEAADLIEKLLVGDELSDRAKALSDELCTKYGCITDTTEILINFGLACQKMGGPR